MNLDRMTMFPVCNSACGKCSRCLYTEWKGRLDGNQKLEVLLEWYHERVVEDDKKIGELFRDQLERRETEFHTKMISILKESSLYDTDERVKEQKEENEENEDSTLQATEIDSLNHEDGSVRNDGEKSSSKDTVVFKILEHHQAEEEEEDDEAQTSDFMSRFRGIPNIRPDATKLDDDKEMIGSEDNENDQYDIEEEDDEEDSGGEYDKASEEDEDDE